MDNDLSLRVIQAINSEFSDISSLGKLDKYRWVQTEIMSFIFKIAVCRSAFSQSNDHRTPHPLYF